MYDETSNDLMIKHEGCYVGYTDPSNGENKLAMLREFYQNDPGYDEICFNFKVRENEGWTGSDVTNWSDYRDNFQLDYPSLGAINHKKTVVVLRRKLKLSSPTKYRKSFRHDSFNYFDPNMMERSELGMTLLNNHSVQTLSVMLGHDIFFNEQLTSDQALNSILSNERVGAAFSEMYYYTLNACNNTISLWRFDNIIGTFHHGKSLFELENDWFLDDLMKFNVPVEIF